MTRTVKIAGLIVALLLTFGGSSLSMNTVWAQAPQDEFLTLSQEETPPAWLQVAMVDAQIQWGVPRTSSVIETFEVPFVPECTGLSDALMVDGAARALCR